MRQQPRRSAGADRATPFVRAVSEPVRPGSGRARRAVRPVHSPQLLLLPLLHPQHADTGAVLQLHPEDAWWKVSAGAPADDGLLQEAREDARWEGAVPMFPSLLQAPHNGVLACLPATTLQPIATVLILV